YKNWTDGCISLKNGDVEDLYNYIPIGTPVTIRK
ncbi:MAG: L,D-transpeptidase family protein, partial [Flavisolibacter sp.]